MKNKHFYLITLLLISISINSLFGQDKIDPPKLQDSLFNLHSNFIKRDFNKFLIAWNYNSPNRTMDSLLKINYALTVASANDDWCMPGHRIDEIDSNWYYFGRPLSNNGPDFMHKQYRLVCTESYNDPYLLNGNGMRYNPDITIDSSDTFTPSIHNADGTVFGWKIKNGIITNPLKPGTIKLQTALGTNELLVLDSIWKNDALFYRSNTDDYNGNKWIMDIHIKVDTTVVPKNLGLSTILKIEMPYHFDPVNYIAADGNKLIRTTDRGSTWEIDTSIKQFNCKSIYFSSHQRGFVCGNDGKLYETYDAGNSWKIIDTTHPTTNNLLCIRYIPKTIWIICGESGLLMSKLDRDAAIWDTITFNPSVTANINNIALVKDSNNVYAVGDAGHFLKSTDGGVNWKDTTITVNNLNSVFFTTNHNGWAVGDYGYILKTTNAGTSWTTLQFSPIYHLKSVFFTSNTNGFATGALGMVWNTTDAGLTWSSQNIGTTQTLNSIFFSDTNRGWVVGDNNTVYNTTDGGSNWSPVNLGLTGPITNLNDISFKYPDNFGKINFTSVPGATGIESAINSNRSSYYDFRGNRKELRIQKSNVLEIKFKDINNYINGSYNYITLSAYINCDDLDDGNPYFKTTTGPNYSRIKDFDIKVTYNPLISIILGSITIATPHARDLFWGQLDFDIAAIEKRLLSRYEGPINYDSAYIHRFYGDNEIGPDLWACNRYYNMLVDTLGALETQNKLYPLFMHATGFKEFWNGSNMSFHKQVFAPYIKQGTNEDCGHIDFGRSFGTKCGYAGMYPAAPYTIDTIKNSRYEVHQDGLPSFNHVDYNSLTNPWLTCLQSSLEGNLFNNYVNHKSMLFSDKPWLEWLFPLSGSWLSDDSLPNPKHAIGTIKVRPCTGEEFNLMSRYSVFLGARGVFYWLKVRIYDIIHMDDEGGGSCMGLQASDSTHYLDALNKDITQFDDPVMNNDFIDFTRDDPQYLWKRHFVHDTYAWNTMDIDSSRVFIGLQTLRYEIKKFNEWIDHNNDLLMKLRLVAWFGKGHANIKIGNYKLGYSDNKIDDFIVSDSIFTRPLNRMQGGNPYYEQSPTADSGFVDVMVEQIDTNNLNRMLVLNVINRRTDPLIFDSVDNKFYFISTHEFENLTMDTAGNAKANPITHIMKTTSYWRDMYWKKQGAREIRFRFNYNKPGNANAKVLFRIKEILTDTAYDNSWAWWQKDRWNNSIHDTVIRSDQEFVLKMLPGSGRMFKIEVQSTAPFTGELANSNQTKVIAYPARQTSNLDYTGHDTALYYHVVYHKINPVSNHYDTYYRRSLFPYNHTVSTKVIQWGPEIKLINNFKVTNQSVPNLKQPMIRNLDAGNCDCKYPTLTARWDEVNQTAKIYVLSSCTETILIDTPRVYIVERAFPTDMNLIQFPTGDTSLAIGFAYAAPQMNGLYSDRWGLSTINASKDGNYIAFNDSIYGIKAGFKLPQDTGYMTNMITFKFNPGMNYNALFPSLNTFSMIPYWDDNAGLAWQETQLGILPTTKSKIYYTILMRNANGNIYKNLPKNICDPTQPNFNDKIYNVDSTMACISPYPLQTYYTYPLVYRNVESVFDQNGNIAAYGAGDRVYWQGGPKKDTISSFYIKMIDLNLGLNCFNCMFPKRVYSSNSQLGQPNASQGELRVLNQFNWSDSAYVVNFISYPTGTQPSYTNADIYQIDHDYWSIFKFAGQWVIHDTTFMNVDYNVAPVGNGLYPHLVRSAVLRQPGDWKLNNRIYETSGPIIKTSETYFLKGEKEYKASYPMLKLIDMRTEESSSFSPFAISNDDNPQMNNFLKINAFEKKGFSYSALDTISTAWFKIGNIKDLSFFTDGNDLKGVNITLERKKDKKKFTLPVKNSKQNIMAMNKLHFINGKDDIYRIIWTKSNDSIIVTSDLLFSDKIDFEGRIDTVSSHSLGKTVTLDENIIDLNWDNTIENNENMNVFVCPNPANDLIYASTNLPLDLYNDRNIKSVKIKYTLINTLGTVITEKEGYLGDVIQFNTSELPNGMYIIQALTDIYNSNHYKNLNGYKSIIIRH